MITRVLGTAACLLAMLVCKPLAAQSPRADIKRIMLPDDFKATGLNKLSSEELKKLNDWLTIYSVTIEHMAIEASRNGSTAQRMPVGSRQGPMVSRTRAATESFDSLNPHRRQQLKSFAQLLDGHISSKNGTFLGKITRSEFDQDSLLNSVGRHGSEVSSTSIFNDVGRYGSDVSSESAFNDLASNPPLIYDKDGQFIAYLTTNELKSPRVDPRALIGWLKSQ